MRKDNWNLFLIFSVCLLAFAISLVVIEGERQKQWHEMEKSISLEVGSTTLKDYEVLPLDEVCGQCELQCSRNRKDFCNYCTSKCCWMYKYFGVDC